MRCIIYIYTYNILEAQDGNELLLIYCMYICRYIDFFLNSVWGAVTVCRSFYYQLLELEELTATNATVLEEVQHELKHR